MAEERYIGTNDRGMPVFESNGRILSAAERVMNHVSESTRETVRKRSSFAGISQAVNRFQRGARGAFDEAASAGSVGGRSRAAIGGFWTGLGGRLGERDMAKEERLAYEEAHPFLGDYLGPDAFPPGNMHGYYPRTGYRANDQFTILRKMNTETMRRLQDRLIRTGFLDPEDMVPGQMNDPFVGAFETVLTIANREGKAWDLVLFDTERAIADGTYDPEASRSGGRAPKVKFSTPTYLAPDYDAIEDNVHSMMVDMLGREPDESELAILAAQFAGLHREAWDKNVEAKRLDFEAQQAGAEGEADQGGATVEGALGGSDLAAKFRQRFRERFSAEIQGDQDQAEAEVTQGLVSGAVSTLSKMSGGMG